MSTSPAGQDLAHLLSRVALGDRQAFESLYRATSAQLFGVVLRINRDRAQAEEVLQEVFVNVWRAAGGFDARLAQPLTWLTSVARNRAIDSLRRRAAEPATVSRFQGADDDEGGEHDLLDAMPAPDAGPLDLLDAASQAHELQRCMQALSGEQRSSLALAYYQGLSHAEVAEHLAQPLGTVKSWVRRGLQSLRLCLDRAGGLINHKAGAV
jgi:RNA polymerase sigma factor (sigma-70 family)